MRKLQRYQRLAELRRLQEEQHQIAAQRLQSELSEAETTPPATSGSAAHWQLHEDLAHRQRTRRESLEQELGRRRQALSQARQDRKKAETLVERERQALKQADHQQETRLLDLWLSGRRG
mgnify:CR=1 FL=1